MENVKVTHKDFIKIAKEHDYFLWHFLQKNQNEQNQTFTISNFFTKPI